VPASAPIASLDPSATNPVPPILIRPGEAARLLGVSRSRAYQLIRQGEIPAILLGGTVRVPLAELREIVAARVQGGAE